MLSPPQIPGAVTQWGQVEIGHREPIEQVFSKSPCANFLDEIAIRRRDDAYIHRDGFG